MLSGIGLDAVRETVRCEQLTERPVGDGTVELVTGSPAITERLSRLRLAATREICTLMAHRSWPTTGDAVNGVPERAVVESGARGGRPPGPGGHGVRVRAVGRVPAEFVLTDRAVALVSLSPRADGAGEPAALLVRPGELLASLTDLFEDVWQRALPVRGRTGEDPAEGPDAVDLEVLSLLLIGLTDTSVARQLGLGLRTVQRRVKRLMELAGVTTRLQLGRHAAERGWTDGH
ncbi:LuxR family transcriptional regulator [Streptomyces sp. NPDC002537]